MLRLLLKTNVLNQPEDESPSTVSDMMQPKCAHCVTVRFGDTSTQRHSWSSAAAEMENTLRLQALMATCLIQDSCRCFMLEL